MSVMNGKSVSLGTASFCNSVKSDFASSALRLSSACSKAFAGPYISWRNGFVFPNRLFHRNLTSSTVAICLARTRPSNVLNLQSFPTISLYRSGAWVVIIAIIRNRTKMTHKWSQRLGGSGSDARPALR